MTTLGPWREPDEAPGLATSSYSLSGMKSALSPQASPMLKPGKASSMASPMLKGRSPPKDLSSPGPLDLSLSSPGDSIAASHGTERHPLESPLPSKTPTPPKQGNSPQLCRKKRYLSEEFSKRVQPRKGLQAMPGNMEWIEDVVGDFDHAGGEMLGEGEGGKVRKKLWRGMVVAVKSLKSREEYKNQDKMLEQVKLCKCCTISLPIRHYSDT